MSSDGALWGEATVTYADWAGTAQLDQHMTSANLSEVIGLDAAEWMPVGIDVSGSEHGGLQLRVVAVHRSLVAPTGSDVFAKITAAHDGEIPATEFLVRDVDPVVVLRAVAHQFRLRMKSRGAQGLPIRIMSRSDIPEQPL